MAANFWNSSHRKHWLLDQITVSRSQKEDLEMALVSQEDIVLLRLFFVDKLLRGLATALSLRQQILATGVVYFKRFYTKNAFRMCNPLLVGPTCIYLACKIEESTVAAARIAQETRKIVEKEFRDESGALVEKMLVDSMAECEYFLLEDLDCYLIVYHPYRPLTQYMAELKIAEHLQIAWNIVNDSYFTDACLLFPPYMIALAAIYVTVVMLQERTPKDDIATQERLGQIQRWFSQINVDLLELAEVTQVLLSFYAVQEVYAKNDSGDLCLRFRRICLRIPPPPTLSAMTTAAAAMPMAGMPIPAPAAVVSATVTVPLQHI